MFNSKSRFELSPRLKLGIGRGQTKNKVIKLSAGLCLVLALALSVNAIRLLFSGNTSTVTTAGAAEPQVLGATDTKQPTLEFVEYKVAKGDTLFNVSQKFGINWTTLATLNNLKSPFSLKVGQILKIPKQ
jgi:hypothetical protein